MPLAFLNLIGRTGNVLFQYAHARAWCEQHGYELSMLPWFGERVFTIPHAIRPSHIKPDLTWTDELFQEQEHLIYTRRQVREWFTFRPEVLEQLKVLEPKYLVLDIRIGQDMIDAGLVCLSPQCYADAARKFDYNPDSAHWERFPESPTRLPSFTGDVGGCGYNTSEVSIPAFYRLMTAQVHFRANSSFSWWAATLGHAKVYSPVIDGLPGGKPNIYCGEWVNDNSPRLTAAHTNLHLPE